VPVLLGEWMKRPALVVAAGANHWYKRELDTAVIEKSDFIVVDEMEQARVEGGNLLYAIAKGALTWDRVEELGDVVNGRIAPPDLRKSTVLFESHGLAINDMAMAQKTYELARAQGIGTEIRL
jgi:ornithine cyclodeaminase/alanine dehydrogenase-like protein (mu-crystallin family)